MSKAIFRFYEELNDYLPRDERKTDIRVNFERPPAVKDAIESFGIPPQEVDLILINGISVDFSYLLRDQDRVSVYPVIERFDIRGLTRLRRTPLRRIKFIADAELFELTVLLRTMGFDVRHEPHSNMTELQHAVRKENRILLTTNAKMIDTQRFSRALLIHSGTVESQVRQILTELNLEQSCDCARCTDSTGKFIELD
jgi:hypothetical protein